MRSGRSPTVWPVPHVSPTFLGSAESVSLWLPVDAVIRAHDIMCGDEDELKSDPYCQVSLRMVDASGMYRRISSKKNTTTVEDDLNPVRLSTLPKASPRVATEEVAQLVVVRKLTFSVVLLIYRNVRFRCGVGRISAIPNLGNKVEAWSSAGYDKRSLTN
eukprot:2819663-Pyramimonas_sp.AAC.4